MLQQPFLLSALDQGQSRAVLLAGLLLAILLPFTLLAQTSSPRAVGPVQQDQLFGDLAESAFRNDQSAALFVGINEFKDSRFAPLRYAVDDAIDLAWHFWKLEHLSADRIRLGLSGDPVKSITRQRLRELQIGRASCRERVSFTV